MAAAPSSCGRRGRRVDRGGYAMRRLRSLPSWRQRGGGAPRPSGDRAAGGRERPPCAHLCASAPLVELEEERAQAPRRPPAAPLRRPGASVWRPSPPPGSRAWPWVRCSGVRDVAEAERHLERAEVLRRASRPTLEHIHALLQLARARLARGRLQLRQPSSRPRSRSSTSFSNAGRLTGLAEDVKQSLNDALAMRSGRWRRRLRSSPPCCGYSRPTSTQRQIAQELYLSLNTAEDHSRSPSTGSSERHRVRRQFAARPEVGLLTFEARLARPSVHQIEQAAPIEEGSERPSNTAFTTPTSTSDRSYPSGQRHQAPPAGLLLRRLPARGDVVRTARLPRA